MVAERHFRAMGSDAHVMVVGPDPEPLVVFAQQRIEDLEAKWSRFRPDSELCRLNNASGRPVLVSAETYAIVSKAVDAWFLTAGRFDPTILPALVAAGYDRTFEEVRPRATTPLPRPPKPPGCAEIRLAPSVNTITLPADVHLDLGGLGKGYAADLVATELLDHGATGALVSLGGDIRCTGTPPWEEGWLIDIEHPFDPDTSAAQLALADGAVVTSTRLKRHWTAADGSPQHHLIDPTTGRPAASGLAAVTVVAADAWWAEALAKAAFLAGRTDGARLLAGLGVTGILFDDFGVAHHVARLEAFQR